jgi:hypothetical protein
MRCPARLPMQASSREAPETEPFATTSGREELADGEAFLLHPAPDRSPKSRGGAPRGERRRCDARRPLAPAGLRYWPADGCRCTRAPVGAPPPHCYEGTTANLGGLRCLARRMMRGWKPLLSTLILRAGRSPASRRMRPGRWPFMVRDALRAPHHEGALDPRLRGDERRMGAMPRPVIRVGYAQCPHPSPGYPPTPEIPSTGKPVSNDPVSLVQ